MFDWLLALPANPYARDAANYLANLATAAGITLAIASVFIGFRTYDDASASARRIQMHEIFRAYLQALHDFQMRSAVTGQLVAALPPSLVTIKLYTMEEIHEWTQVETRLAGRRWFRWAANTSRLNYVGCWIDTLRAHLGVSTEATLANLEHYRGCYSPEFRSFMATIPGLETVRQD